MEYRCSKLLPKPVPTDDVVVLMRPVPSPQPHSASGGIARVVWGVNSACQITIISHLRTATHERQSKRICIVIDAQATAAAAAIAHSVGKRLVIVFLVHKML